MGKHSVSQNPVETLKGEELKLVNVRKYYIFFIMFVSYNSLKVWEEVPPPMKAYLPPLLMKERHFLPSF